MRQVWISKAGPPEVLELKEAHDPQPAAGELRIRVEASGINFADIMGRLGLYPDLPRIPVVPGYEVAGRVDAAGGGANDVSQPRAARSRSGAVAASALEGDEGSPCRLGGGSIDCPLGSMSAS